MTPDNGRDEMPVVVQDTLAGAFATVERMVRALCGIGYAVGVAAPNTLRMPRMKAKRVLHERTK